MRATRRGGGRRLQLHLVMADPLQGQERDFVMRRVLISTLATAAFAMSVAPAQAADIYQCGVNAPSGSSCISDTDNVLLTNAENVMVGSGTVEGRPIQFRTTDLDGIDLDASGQATIYSGTEDGVINNLTWELIGGDAFSRAEFNLIDLGNVDFDVTITTLLNGVLTSSTYTGLATFNGQNRFGVVAGANEVITGVTINSTTGFGSFKQLRIDLANAPAVPEPATWAMMLLGFGGIGMTMRRKQRSNGALMQVA